MSDDQHVFTLMEQKPGDVAKLIYGLHGIANAIYDSHFMELSEQAQLLLMTLRALSEDLYSRVGDIDTRLESHLKQAVAEFRQEQH